MKFVAGVVVGAILALAVPVSAEVELECKPVAKPELRCSPPDFPPYSPKPLACRNS